MHQLILQENLNFRENDKKIKQKVTNDNVLMLTKAIFGQKCESVSAASQSEMQKKKSVATSSTSRSKGKEGRLLLRDYLYLTNKNSEKLREEKNKERSKDKEELRKAKYKLDEEKIFYLMQDEMKAQLNEVIQRLQKMKESFKEKSLKNEDKNNTENIALIYSIKSIIKEKFKKGIEEINMIVFQEEQRKCQFLSPFPDKRPDQLLSDTCFNGKTFRKKEHKISLQLEKDANMSLRENNIPINGSKFMADFV